MIVPMKKYAFLVYHAQYHDFLKELRKLGVVDVVQHTKDVDDSTRDKLLLHKQIGDSIKLLQRRNTNQVAIEIPFSDGMALMGHIRNLVFEEEQVQQRIANVNKEIAHLEPWGDYSPETISKLLKAGLRVGFYTCSIRKYNPEWEQQYNIGIVNTISPNMYFIVVNDDSNQIIDIDAEEIRFPERPFSAAIQHREKLQARATEIQGELEQLAHKGIELLHVAQQHLFSQIEFDKVLLNTRSESGDKVMLLEGFVPTSMEAQVVRFCEEHNIVSVNDFPGKGEKVPVLLKNNRFAKLFEPIGKLFSLPAYNELDLTPFFAPFFMMFFGFCLGDAGYGLLIVIAATIYKPRAKPAWKPYLSLAQLLGSATVIFGIISGTLFGINLIEAQIPLLDPVRGLFLDSEKMFYLALIIGGIQIVFGMFVKVMNIIKQFGFAYALSTIGWLILIIGMLGRQALIHYGIIAEAEAAVKYSILGISGILILLLNDPSVSIFTRLGKGVWDIYGMVTGIFGDLLSYIRLFALGISSAILGLVINSIGLDLLGIPVVGPLFFVLFLTVGHLGNILISSLGSFVHPMRLTFVEFYKNAGFMGGGRVYRPFSDKRKN